MNILSIGNSFSQDGQRYLNAIAKADGVNLQTFNLHIGACSLSRHYRNMLSRERAYFLEMNGRSTGFHVSLEEGLLNRDWDIITVQQVSNEAPYYETYQPYLNKLVEYVRACVPKAKIYIQQTWAYEQDSHRLNEELKYSDYKQMLRDIKASYQKAAQDIGADGIIPSGEVFAALIESGAGKVHRDTFHAGYGLGRYALGLTWYSILTGNEIADNTFADFDEEITPQQISIAKKCVFETVRKYRSRIEPV